MDSSGNVYGTTYIGGADNAGNGIQAPIRTLSDSLLYTFTGGGDQERPLSVRTCWRFGGQFLRHNICWRRYYMCMGGWGRNYKWSAAPCSKLSGTTLTTLYTFELDANGGAPEDTGVLAQDKLGDIYGTTALGGAYSYGTVFKITPSGTLTTLYNFEGVDDGCFPVCSSCIGLSR